MKVLIADKLSEKAATALRDFGAEVTVNPDLGSDDLPGVINDTEVLVVRSTKVLAQTIEAAPSLSLIIRAGAGVNTIDLDKASSHGIHVANCPGKNTDAVAELAMGLLIACDRRIVDASNDLKNGKWRKKEYQKSNGLKTRTLGIVGFGSIGKALSERAKGMDMHVAAWSRSLTEDIAEELDIEYCATPEQLAQKSDAISVHLAANGDTHHFIDSNFLNSMKNEAIFVNTSRGQVVDTEALKKAISEKNLRVGIDVYENEPSGGNADFDDTEFAQMVTGTPHIGASTYQASEAIADEVVRVFKNYVETGKPFNAVNIRDKKSKNNLVVRHYNRVGVLASVLDELRNEGINIEEMENTIFKGGEAASCTLLLDRAPSKDMVSGIKKMDNIIQVMLKEGNKS
ncbi:MAG TPA: NAD(P)-dependent oxidoreductase [Balneolales bacterium]|nr:NAD(P)-dependent oxidoreductase [Balneolales bacterium]